MSLAPGPGPLREDPWPMLRGVLAAHPDLAGQTPELLEAGWDTLALKVGDRALLRVPRDGDAAASLRREARLLALVRPRLRLPVPDLALHEAPTLHSRHRPLPGVHLLAADWARLGDRGRDGIARAVAGFLADLHAVPPGVAEAAGVGPLEPWLPPGAILDGALPHLPAALQPRAEALVRAWADLPPDPLGEGLGHFDAHGWNMAFDPAAERLNGLYDFGDAGIGPRHGEFVAPGLVSADLARRVMTAYEGETGRAVDRERVRVLSGTARLWELAREADDPATRPLMLAGVLDWFAAA